MTVNYPTTPAKPVKPAKPSKPYPEFPLFAHAAGVWAKKIRGKLHYFGGWSDPDAALEKYLKEKDALHSGRKPRPDTEGFTVADAANAFLNHKRSRCDNGELSERTWAGYKSAADETVATFGKRRLVCDLDPDDFARLRNKAAKRLGPHGLGTFIQSVRCLFKYAADNGLIDHPVQYGTTFKKPSRKVIRKHRAEKGPKLFSPEEIRCLIDNALTPFKSMVLLAINCGFGPSDCGNLPLAAVDLDAGWIDYPRPKTGVARRCPLWPETIIALREALVRRQEAKKPEHAGLFFITRCGDSWAKQTAENPISDMASKLIRKLGIGRRGIGFYGLRHCFRTVADETKDQVACDHIMGHEAPGMASIYRERIGDERLKAVTDHVHGWLFAAAATVESKADAADQDGGEEE